MLSTTAGLPAGNGAVSDADPAALKATYNAVVTVITEAAKVDADVEALRFVRRFLHSGLV